MKSNFLSLKIFVLCFFINFSNISIGYANQITLAVMDLEIPDYLKSQQIPLSDRLRSELVNTGKFIIVERNKMKQILEEQELPLYGIVDSKSATEIGKLLGAKQIVAGSVSKVGSIFSVSTRMIDVESGEVMMTADMDCECPIEDVLTIMLKDVARKLANLPTDEGGYSRIKKKLPEVFTLKEISKYGLPFSVKSYADMVWNGERLYVGTNDGNVYRVNTELGMKVEEVYPVKNSQIAAIGWDGANLWVARMGDGAIIKFKMDKNLSIDFIFRNVGSDTYPYAMAIDNNNLFIGGYSKELMQYKIISPTEIKKIDTVEINAIILALTTIDGRLFAIADGKFCEIVGDKLQSFININLPPSSTGMAYDGRFFWILTNDNLIKYQVLKIEKKEQELLETSVSSNMQILEKYEYLPQRPTGIAWDGNTIWTLSQGKNAGIYIHKLDTSLSIVHSFQFEHKWREINVDYGYGSFTWDGNSFWVKGYLFNDETENEINYILRLKPIQRNSNTGIQELHVAETVKFPIGNISAITWGNGYLWVATGQNTKETAEGSFIHKLKKTKEGDWEIVKTYKYVGYRCQGLAWDGENLLSYDVFNKKFYRHKVDENLSVISEYRGGNNTDLAYYSGLTWDGKYFWTTNYKTNKVYKILFAPL